MESESKISEKDLGRRIAGWMIVLLWIILLAGAALLAQRWLDDRAQARVARLLVNEYGKQALLIPADRYGQYLITGQVNEQSVLFLLDTGASGISIPSVVADRLQLEPGRPFEVITANGRTTVFRTELNKLSIGPFGRTHLDAHINPSMPGEIGLLGMSFLRHFRLEQLNGELTISLPDLR
ncbi:MAG: TIGR02281 family clan AA aspartic protease [Granulosicoccus sp.]